MLEFIMDWLINPIFDLILCKLKWKNWLKHLLIGLLLGLASLVFITMLVLGAGAGNWFWSILGLAGMLFFGYVDIKYTNWWIREGRFQE